MVVVDVVVGGSVVVVVDVVVGGSVVVVVDVVVGGRVVVVVVDVVVGGSVVVVVDVVVGGRVVVVVVDVVVGGGVVVVVVVVDVVVVVGGVVEHAPGSGGSTGWRTTLVTGPLLTSKIWSPVGLVSKNTIGLSGLSPVTALLLLVCPLNRYWPLPVTAPLLVKSPPTVIAASVCENAPLFIRPAAVSEQELMNVPHRSRSSTPPTSMSPVLVNVPVMLSTPAIVSTLLLVTVLPLRLTDPLIAIMPSLMTVAPGPRLMPGESTMIVAPGWLIAVANPLTLIWARKRTVPSFSRRACASMFSAGNSAVPRTKSRPEPFRTVGLKLARPATQIVAPPALTVIVKMPDANNTTSVLDRLSGSGGGLVSL